MGGSDRDYGPPGCSARLGDEQTSRVALAKLLPVAAPLERCPRDFRLVLHDHLGDSYERSRVLLATARLDGTLQLLTAAWEQVLGYGRDDLRVQTLSRLMWFNRRSAAAAVAAILDEFDMGPLDLRLRCWNGLGKCLTLHRLYDKWEKMMYIVGVETPAKPQAPRRTERRASAREA